MKNEIFPQFTSLFCKQILYILFILYFMIGFLLKSSVLLALFYFLCPCLFLLFCFYFLRNQKRKSLLSHIQYLLTPLSSQINMGSSFMTAWDKISKDPKNKKFKKELGQITNTFKFGSRLDHPDKDINLIVQDLVEIKNSPQPSKRLRHLKQKVKTEMVFQQKAGRVLFQLKMQSQLIAIFYLILLVWVSIYSGRKHLQLMLISFLFFSLGLILILSMGKKMKWSL